MVYGNHVKFVKHIQKSSAKIRDGGGGSCWKIVLLTIPTIPLGIGGAVTPRYRRFCKDYIMDDDLYSFIKFSFIFKIVEKWRSTRSCNWIWNLDFFLYDLLFNDWLSDTSKYNIILICFPVIRYNRGAGKNPFLKSRN